MTVSTHTHRRGASTRASSLLVVVALVVAICPDGVSAQSEGWTTLRTFLARDFGATPAQLERLRAGEPFVAVVEGSVRREVAVAGAIRIGGPARRTVDVLRDVETLERGKAFLHTRRLSTPPSVRDFDAFVVSPEDLAALRVCRPGQCDVKLRPDDLSKLASLDWRAPDIADRVNRLARQAAFDYVEAYRRGGNAELAVYADATRPTFVAKEFVDLVKQSSRLPNVAPDLASYLVEYPKRAAALRVDDLFYWSEADFGLKPVFRINHLVVHERVGAGGPQFVVATKQLYANHYFHTGLEVRVLVDDDADARATHYLVVLNLARSDGMTGLFGGIVKAKVQAASREGLRRVLMATRARVEGRPPGASSQ